MATVIAFVDSATASPTTRLDINTDPWMVTYDNFDISPPEIRRSLSSTLLVDGENVSASALGNRLLILRLELTAASEDLAATQLQTLARELNRKTNFLKYQLDTTNPVFFRTFRSPNYKLEKLDRGGSVYYAAQVEILAEHAAYGPKETLSAVTVNNDPGNATNGCWFDITSPKGDVETPLFLVAPTGLIVTGRRKSVVGVRQRGTPSATPFVLQAESLTMGTDTSLPGNDVLMSGSGSNYARTTFSTAIAMTTRLSSGGGQEHPTSASVDARGRYRVFSRHRKSVAGDVIKVRLNLASNGLAVTGDTVTLAANHTDPFYADLGVYNIPMGYDPVTDGFSGTEVAAHGLFVDFQAERTSGTGNLDTDVFLWVPADVNLAFINWPATGGATDFIVDGKANQVYARGSSSEVRTHEITNVVSRLPMIAPGVTNRFFFIRDVGQTASTGDVISGSTQLTPYYWPRYLTVRPATT